MIPKFYVFFLDTFFCFCYHIDVVSRNLCQNLWENDNVFTQILETTVISVSGADCGHRALHVLCLKENDDVSLFPLILFLCGLTVLSGCLEYRARAESSLSVAPACVFPM